MLCGRLRGGLQILVIAVIGLTSSQSVQCDPELLTGLGIERQDVDPRVITLERDKMLTFDSLGRSSKVPVTLEETYYRAKVEIRGKTDVRKVYVNRYELRWEKQGRTQSWSVWSDYPLGEFRLLQDGAGTNHLVWVHMGRICFAPITSSRDKNAAFREDFLQRKHGPPNMVIVPVLAILGSDAFRPAGIGDAQVSPIKVLSIARDADKHWVVTMRDPRSRKVYSLVSDAKSRFGWRVAK